MLTEKEVNYNTVYKNFNNMSLYKCGCPFESGEADFKDDVSALEAEGKIDYCIQIYAPPGAFDQPKDVESRFNLFVDACNIRPNVIFGPEMKVYDEKTICFFAKLTEDEVEKVRLAEGLSCIEEAEYFNDCEDKEEGWYFDDCEDKEEDWYFDDCEDKEEGWYW